MTSCAGGTVADSYAEANGGARVFVVRGLGEPAAELARYVRPDELHTTFNFDALMCEWTAESQRNVIDLTLASTSAVGGRHRCSRTTTRPGWSPATVDPSPGSGSVGRDRQNRSLASAWCRQATPMSPSAGSGPERRCCSSWLCRAARPSIKVTSWAWRRSRTCPRTCCGPVWKRPATLYVDGTAAGCRFRGRVRSHLRIRVGGAPGLATAACVLGKPDRRRARRSPGQHAEPVSGGTRRTSAKPRVGGRHPDRDDDALDGVLSFTREPGFRCVVNFGPGRYEIPEGAEVLVSSGLSSPRSVGMDEAVWLRV